MNKTAPSKLFEIFFPYALQKQQEVLKENRRFVYYTSAETAISIIKDNEIWMRSVRCMNDYMEVSYGLERLIEAYKSSAGDKFKKALDNVFPRIIEEIEALFDSWLFELKNDTYITCFSEHLNEEDGIGRLSMWRAYGKSSGIALVMNNKGFLAKSDVLKIYNSPVSYFERQDIIAQLDNIAANIIRESDYIKSQNRDIIKNSVFSMFMFAILCIKHPGFKEEKEWRIVYCPDIMKSSYVKKEIRTINGIPQPIYKIPLISMPDEGLCASIPELLEQIIIGPTEYSLEIYKAFIETLTEVGIEAPKAKIVASNIPLRR